MFGRKSAPPPPGIGYPILMGDWRLRIMAAVSAGTPVEMTSADFIMLTTTRVGDAHLTCWDALGLGEMVPVTINGRPYEKPRSLELRRVEALERIASALEARNTPTTRRTR